ASGGGDVRVGARAGALRRGPAARRASCTKPASSGAPASRLPNGSLRAPSGGVDLNEKLLANPVMEKLVSLCKRRGFIFQSSEIYGGLNSCYDYGPLGVELKNNIKSCWWRSMTYHHDNIEGVDASILMHPRVWEASGHVAGFTDPLVDCKKCKQRYRQDQVDSKSCPNCGGPLTEPRMFNLMFKTFMGPVENQAAVVFLRPETAQG